MATTEENAIELLPYLVYAAQQRQLITYEALMSRINKPAILAGATLGFIRDEIVLPRSRPMITAIGISKETGLPGDQFLPEGTDHLSKEEYKAAFEKHRDEVFRYQGWDDLLRELGLKPITKTPQDLDEEGRIHNEIEGRSGTSGEGEPHLNLKNYVAAHPARFGLYAQEAPIIEYQFVSGDRCDVVFDLDTQGTAVIEVKNGERGELVKGIYQAVKYRALMEAEKGHGQPHPIKALLVAYDIPEDIAAFAKQLNIQCYTINRDTIAQFIEKA